MRPRIVKDGADRQVNSSLVERPVLVPAQAAWPVSALCVRRGNRVRQNRGNRL